MAALRARKHREDRPFALMAAILEAARALVELSPEDERLLTGRERPIVIARRREGVAVADSVAPQSRDLGVMLPYSPLHHLLLAEAVGTTLVMTSAKRLRRADRLRGADAGGVLTASRTHSWCTTARYRRARTTRWCAPRLAGR